MFKEIDLLENSDIVQLQKIAASAQFVDGRISNPHNEAKKNLQLHDAAKYQQSAQILMQALMRHEDFRNFAFPAKIAPPLMTRYTPGMGYGSHSDSAFIPLPTGPLRSDLSCTIFLNDPSAYDGGSLRIQLGTQNVRFRGAAGTAVIYPSDMLHEVEPVTKGERLVAITFMQSSIKNPFEREQLYELNEVAALEGLNMNADTYTRLRLIQQNLLRYWSDTP